MAENQATAILEGLRIGLRELGYVEGRTIILDYRFAKGRPEALPGLAEELVRIPAEVIVTDTVPLPVAAADEPRVRHVSVAPLFAEALRSIYEETSISRLFA